MPYMEITDKQFYLLLEDFIGECSSTEKMHKLTMKVLRQYLMFEGADAKPLQKLIDKHISEIPDNEGDW